jgi:hypothetical protein
MPPLGIWVAGFLTLVIFSFLYRDNPFYRTAEHIYVGVSAGYYIAIMWHSVLVPNLFVPLVHGGHFLLLVPGVLSALLFTRFLPRGGWLARWPIALYIGVYAAINLQQYVQGDIIPQTQATILPLNRIGNLVILVGTLVTLSYFFFSREHRGALGVSAKAGMWFLMISFGAAFGTTVMSRMSLLIARAYFLIHDWLTPTLAALH